MYVPSREACFGETKSERQSFTIKSGKNNFGTHVRAATEHYWKALKKQGLETIGFPERMEAFPTKGHVEIPSNGDSFLRTLRRVL